MKKTLVIECPYAPGGKYDHIWTTWHERAMELGEQHEKTHECRFLQELKEFSLDGDDYEVLLCELPAYKNLFDNHSVARLLEEAFGLDIHCYGSGGKYTQEYWFGDARDEVLLKMKRNCIRDREVWTAGYSYSYHEMTPLVSLEKRLEMQGEPVCVFCGKPEDKESRWNRFTNCGGIRSRRHATPYDGVAYRISVLNRDTAYIELKGGAVAHFDCMERFQSNYERLYERRRESIKSSKLILKTVRRYLGGKIDLEELKCQQRSQ